MATLEVRGRFWLPETPEKTVAGILRFTPGDGGRLDLIGQVSDLGASAVPRIVGTTSQGQSITLDNCRPIKWHIGFGPGLGEQSFAVGVIFDGLEYKANEQPVVDEVVVAMRHLFDWMGVDGLTETHGDGLRSFGLSVLPGMRAELGHGVELTLGHTIGVTGDRAERVLAQGATVRLKFDAFQDYVRASRIVTNIQDFVSISTNRIAQIESFKFFAPGVARKDPNGGPPLRVPIDLHVEWIAQEYSSKKVYAVAVPIPFAAIGGVDGVVTWLQTTKDLQPFITRVMATRYQRNMYADDRFFNRAAVLDGMRRKMAPKSEETYAQRLKALADVAGDPFVHLVGDVDAWIKKVVLERNDHAHHLGNATQTTGAVRYYLADSAYWLFILVLLRQCQYPQAIFDSIVVDDEFDWVRRGLIGII